MMNFLKKYFHYSRMERNGLFVLTAICVAFVIAPTIFKSVVKKEGKTDFSQFKSQIDSFFQQKEEKNTAIFEVQLFPFNPNTASVEDFQKLGLSKKVASIIENYRNKGGKFYKKADFKKIYGIEEADYERLENFIFLNHEKQNYETEEKYFAEEKEREFELFEFDPNTVSREDLKRLGLPEKAINIMMNYRKKGGTFRKREDLSKIYGITEEDFERLFPYIKIAEKEPSKLFASNEIKTASENYEETTSLKIEINSATPEEWQQLRGIGDYFAQKICGFRDKLGGFVSIDQISETYNLPDSTFQKIKPFLVLEGDGKKINVNTALPKDLAAHPYLNWNQANAIVKYRDQHGTFTSLDQLDNVRILGSETLIKIKPYLLIE